jgi:nickel-dependent lactate racemase
MEQTAKGMAHMRIELPYGQGYQTLEIQQEALAGVLTARMPQAPQDQAGLVAQALARPFGSAPLAQLARGKKQVVILASDHTRPVPSRLLMPALLDQIREGSPEAQVTILIATGCHRQTSRRELAEKFGEQIVRRERIAIHDCDDEAMLCDLGRLPSGGRLRINRLAAQADLLVSEGFIEPHFFAGFSGGRKSVLPGVCARETVLANHCAAFIDAPGARTGVLADNPIHRDMVFAARRAGLAFILNVVLDAQKRVVFAAAGDCEAAHEAGCAFLQDRCRISAPPAPIVITTNGGHPLDQNIYQAVKSMTAAEALVRPGGVIVALARAGDGHGGQAFFDQMRSPDLDAVNRAFHTRAPEQTQPDQWQSQIFIRVLKKARVVLVSDAPEAMVRAMHMIPAKTVQEGYRIARTLCGPQAQALVIPDGVSVIAQA